MKTSQQDDASCLLVTEERDGSVHPLLQIAEADNVAEGFNAVQNAVGAAECLDQPVHLQVFIHPEGIESRSVKPGEEHVDHDQKIQLLVLQPEGDVSIVILKFFAGCVIV